MKALKILGGIVLTLGLAVGVFWFGWLRAPAADDVCNNMVAVTKKENGDKLPASAVDEIRDACMLVANKAPEFGRVKWVRQLKCIRDADSSKAIDACEHS